MQGPEPRDPPANAAIREADIILPVGDHRINEQTTFTEALFAYGPGDTVPVTILRNGREQQVQVTLGERPA